MVKLILREPQDERFHIPLVVRISNHELTNTGSSAPWRMRNGGSSRDAYVTGLARARSSGDAAPNTRAPVTIAVTVPNAGALVAIAVAVPIAGGLGATATAGAHT